MASVTINGVSYTGQSVVVSGSRVVVDGHVVDPVAGGGVEAKAINITVTGDIARLEVEDCASLFVSGNVGALSSVRGDVGIAGDVHGAVSSVSGDVTCRGTIHGGVTTVSGDIRGGA